MMNQTEVRALIESVLASPDVQDALWLAEGYQQASPGAFRVRLRDPEADFEWKEADDRALGVLTWQMERGNLLSGRVFEGDTRRPDPPVAFEALEAFPASSGTSAEASKPWRPGDDAPQLGGVRAAPAFAECGTKCSALASEVPDVPRYPALWAYPTASYPAVAAGVTRAEIAEARASERVSKPWRPTDDPQSLGALRAVPVLIPRFSGVDSMPCWSE